jgi:DNA-nicking Smr family endonuclease
MTDRSSSRPGDRDLFAEAMRDVQPLPDRPEAPPRPPAGRRRPAAVPGRSARPARPVPATRFEIEEAGERVAGRLPGFDLRQVRRLERGELPPELTVDLHGFAAAEARGALRDALRRARRSGLRTVLVIHGRGLRSAAGPVLKSELPGWLGEPPLGTWVLAFASAPPRLGGPGATLVLLRRRETA